MFRKCEPSIHPDVEISEQLSKNSFPNTPAFLGLIEWQTPAGKVPIGMLQEMIENHGTGHSYLLERLNNYMERILARGRDTLDPLERTGTFTDPKGYEELPEHLQVLLGSRASDFMQLLGKRTAEMHLALLSGNYTPDFRPEEFSLHYQRSLFSSMQSLVRESYQTLHRHLQELPAWVQEEADPVIGKRNDILEKAKKIYAKKLDISKIRIHGNYDLKKVLLTGKDIVIQDFGGDPYKSYSERRIRRSAVSDVTHMMTSIYYVAYEGFFNNNQVQKNELVSLLPFADQWAFFMSGFFLKKYYEAIGESTLLPADKEDLRTVLETLLTERTLYHLNYELNKRPEWVIVPLRLLKSILTS